MSNGRPDVCVIIPTTCESRRQSFLERALRSVRMQQGVGVEIIVVVNGGLFDPDLVKRLRSDSTIKTVQLDEAHVSLARFRGVRDSTSEYVCFLDDDDELLPRALCSRVQTLRSRSDIDVLVTNGYFFCDCDELLVDAKFAAAIAQDPIQSFLTTNWFASPASTFRRSSLGPSFFDLPYKYFEWTYLFFKLIAAGKRVEYSDAVTYRKFENHDLAVSKSEAYGLAYPGLLLDLLQLPLDERVHAALKRRYRKALNRLFERHLYSGELRLAWSILVRRLRSVAWRHTPAVKTVSKSLLDRRGRDAPLSRHEGRLETGYNEDETPKTSSTGL